MVRDKINEAAKKLVEARQILQSVSRESDIVESPSRQSTIANSMRDIEKIVNDLNQF